MSSNVSMIVSEIQGLKAEILSLKSQVSGLQGMLSSKPLSAEGAAEKPSKGKQGKAKKEKKEKDPDAPARAPTDWRLFTERVGTLLKSEGYKGKDLAVGCLQFCATLKKENDEFSSWADADILARRTDWVAPEAKPKEKKGSSSAAASVVSGDAELEDDAKPVKKARKSAWEGLSEEARAAKVAKMQQGRLAKKEKKESSDAEDAPAPASPKPVAKKSEAAPKTFTPHSPKTPFLSAGSTNAAGGAAASAASAAPAEAAAAPQKDEFRPVMLQSKRYFVNLSTGHAYFRNEDGSQGDWAGLFKKTGNPDPKKPNAPWIDDSYPEADAEAEEEELTFGDE